MPTPPQRSRNLHCRCRRHFHKRANAATLNGAKTFHLRESDPHLYPLRNRIPGQPRPSLSGHPRPEAVCRLLRLGGTIDPLAGGAFSMFGGLIVGRNVELVTNQRIVQAWRPTHWDPGIYSIVHFEFNPSAAKTNMIFDHTGFPVGGLRPPRLGLVQPLLEPSEEIPVLEIAIQARFIPSSAWFQRGLNMNRTWIGPGLDLDLNWIQSVGPKSVPFHAAFFAV